MPKVILIDDDEMLLEMYRVKFTQKGCEVLTALDGEQGLTLIKEQKPDLIILDILMPKIDGIAVLKQLRQEAPEIALIPVVVLSNFDAPGTKKEVLELGAKDYVLKSNFTPDQLYEKVKDYLAK
jgi:DNA-binding response OmpR family regulator